jgi:hypothetical protein
MRQVVSDTGPLISLEKLSQGYDFIRQLYDKLIISPVVLEEAAAGQFATPSEYLQHYGISDLIEVRTVSRPHELPEAERLPDGETHAIQLARDIWVREFVASRRGVPRPCGRIPERQFAAPASNRRQPPASVNGLAPNWPARF